MLRVATLMLCVLLAAVAAGRYRAEVSVRETRKEIRALENSVENERRRIQILRAELAWLEGADRLTKIAREKTDLQPVSGKQLLSSTEFVTALGGAINDVPAVLDESVALLEARDK